jgi:oligosaccharide repeat unit polymerase
MPLVESIFNVLLMIGFGLLLFFARYKFKISFLAPALFYGLFWFFISLLTVLNSGIFPINPLTILYIISSFLMMLFAHISLNKFSLKHQRKYSFRWNKIIIITGLFFGFFAIITMMIAHGFGFSDLLSPSKIILLSNEAYASKVKGEFSPPLLYSILISIFYSSCIFAGIQYSNNIKSSRIVFLPFLVGILIMFVETTKAPFLYTLILWIGGYFSAKAFEGSTELFSKKFKKIVKRLFIAILLLFIISSINRYNLLENSNKNIFSLILMKFQIYFFGGLSSFNDWFLNVYTFSSFDIGFGKYTFGVFDKERGVFSDFTKFENNYSTNIYTYFRHLIVDFGVIGGLLFHFLIGFVLSIIYRLVQSGWKILIPLLAISYTFTMWSFIISILIYKTILVALFISIILIFLSQIKFKNE